jgi:transcriptional regulator with GAF, ATPase, and Fis domain
MKLDEQTLQNLLAAAFTIQEFNGRNLAGMAQPDEAEELLHHIPSFCTDCLTDVVNEEHAAAVRENAEQNKNEIAGVEEQTDLQPAPQISSHLLQEVVQQALRATNATSAAIALNQQGRLICVKVAGDSPSPIAAMINAESGFTRICASTKTVQFCTNTMLDPRVDAEACRKIGIRAVIVVPLLHEHRLLGLISVFSRKPYAFGDRGLKSLLGLMQRFSANLETGVEPAASSTESAAS